MLQTERRDRILEILQQKRYATVQNLAEEIFASTATVRRDLKALSSAGLINISYGGVSISQAGRKNVPLPLREGEHVAVKRLIAQRAARLVRPHDIIFIDGSSTAMNLTNYLSADMDLTVFTYCVDTAMRLSRKNVTTFCTGGRLNLHSSTLTGYFAERDFEMVNADILFLSSQGLSLESGAIMDSSVEETRLRQIMIRQSRRRVFLCDSSKFGQRFPFTLSSVEEMDDIVCDAEIPERFRVNQITL